MGRRVGREGRDAGEIEIGLWANGEADTTECRAGSVDVEALLLVFVETVVESAEGDSQFSRGGAAVAVVASQGGEDVLALQLVQRGGRRKIGRKGRWKGSDGGGGGGFFKAFAGAVEGLFELAEMGRLGEEFDDVEVNGFFGGVEIAKAGEDDDLGGGMGFADSFEELQAGHGG